MMSKTIVFLRNLVTPHRGNELGRKRRRVFSYDNHEGAKEIIFDHFSLKHNPCSDG